MAYCGLDSEWESGSRGSATTSLQIPGSTDSSLHVDSGTISLDAAEPAVETVVSREKQKVSGPASGKRRLKLEELRIRGEGELQGYFIKIYSENKEEHEYD
ncbi:AcrB/AcrD/AcrF family protein [Sesbania bispinosa]|nr:AcrB/AcrD/AcrF family protein [Sesbania bispinosa]